MENQNNKSFNIYDVLLYFGGFALFLGIYYLIFVAWDTTNLLLQVFFTLIVALFLIYLGYFLIVRKNLFKLGFPLIFISFFLLPVGFFVLFNNLSFNYALSFDYYYYYVFTFLLTALIFNYLYKFIDNIVILFFSLVYYVFSYWFFVYLYAQMFTHSSIRQSFYSLAAIFLGSSGLFLAQYFKDKKNFIYGFLNLFSINFLLGGGFDFTFFNPTRIEAAQDFNLSWLIFYPIFVFIILNIGIRYKEIFTKVFSLFYFIIFIFNSLLKYLDSRYYVATILIVLGLVLLGTGYYQYVRKPYQLPQDPTKPGN